MFQCFTLIKCFHVIKTIRDQALCPNFRKPTRLFSTLCFFHQAFLPPGIFSTSLFSPVVVPPGLFSPVVFSTKLFFHAPWCTSNGSFSFCAMLKIWTEIRLENSKTNLFLLFVILTERSLGKMIIDHRYSPIPLVIKSNPPSIAIGHWFWVKYVYMILSFSPTNMSINNQCYELNLDIIFFFSHKAGLSSLSRVKPAKWMNRYSLGRFQFSKYNKYFTLFSRTSLRTNCHSLSISIKYIVFSILSLYVFKISLFEANGGNVVQNTWYFFYTFLYLPC